MGVHKRNRKPSTVKKYLLPTYIAKDITAMKNSKSKKYFLKSDNDLVDEILENLNNIEKFNMLYYHLPKDIVKTKSGYKQQLEYIIEIQKLYFRINDIFRHMIVKRDLVRYDPYSNNRPILNKYIDILDRLNFTNDKWYNRQEKLKRRLKEFK